MTIQIQCEACASQYELDDDDAGQQVQCACGHTMTVPSSDADASDSTSISVTCTECSASYELGLEDAGQQVQCACGAMLTVPGEAVAQLSIPLECAACGAAYELGPEDAGQQVQCACGETLTVPTLDKIAGSESAPAGTKAANSQVSGVVSVTCSGCSSVYEVGADEAGEEMQCPCGTMVLVPSSAVKIPEKDAPDQTKTKSKSQGKKTPDGNKADGGPGKADKPDEDAKSEKARKYAESKETKKSGKLILGGMAVGIVGLIFALVFILSRDAETDGTEVDKKNAVASETVAVAVRDPLEYRSYISVDCVGIVLINQRQMMQAPTVRTVLNDEVSQGIADNLGVDVRELERVVLFLESSLFNFTDEQPSPPFPLAYAQSSGKFKKNVLLTASLGIFESKSEGGHEYFANQHQAVFFADDNTVVLGELKQVQAALEALSQAEPASPMFDSLKQAESGGHIVVAAALQNYRDQLAGLVSFVPGVPPGLADGFKKTSTVILRTYFSGATLMRLTVSTEDDATAETLQGALDAGLKLVAQMSAANKPSTAAPPQPKDPPAGEPATTIPELAAVLEMVDSIIGKINVGRSNADVIVSVPVPTGFAKLAESLQPLIMAEVTGRATETVAGKPDDSAASSIRRRDKTVKDSGDVFFPIRPANPDKLRRFEDAAKEFELLSTKLPPLEEKIEKAKDAEKTKLQAEYRQIMAEAVGFLKVAEKLAQEYVRDPQREKELEQSRASLMMARYMLGYYYLKMGLVYEAAIMSEWVAKNAEDKDQIKDSMAFALDAYNRAFESAPKNDYHIELRGFQRITELIEREQPDLDKLDDIRLALGQRLKFDTQLDAAALWFAKISPSHELYDQANISAGKTYYTLYQEIAEAHPKIKLYDPSKKEEAVPDPTGSGGGSGSSEEPKKSNVAGPDSGAGTKPDSPPKELPGEKSVAPPKSDPPTPDSNADLPKVVVPEKVEDPETVRIRDQMNKYLGMAITHLRTGVKAAEKKKPEQAPDLLIDAKRFLAHMEVLRGNYENVIPVLVDEPYPVVAAIKVDEGVERPDKGITSVDFAANVYQILLRAYVATKQPQLAREAMQSLEAVSDKQDADKLTSTYLSMGKQLLEELNASPPARAAEIRDAFTSFLDEMAKRETQTFNALFWLAESYRSLGDSVAETDAEIARGYFTKSAATYGQIIDHAAKDRTFVSLRSIGAIRIREAKALRRAGNYAEAVKAFRSILALNPNTFDLQFEAASTLQEWGTQTDQKEMLRESTVGIWVDGKPTAVWGWAKSARMLHTHIDKGTAKPHYRDLMLTARSNSAVARRAYALSRTDADEKKKELDGLVRNLKAHASIETDFSGWEQLAEIYNLARQDLGLEPEALIPAAGSAKSKDGVPRSVTDTP